MAKTRWSPSDYRNYKTTASTKTTEELFTSTTLKKDMDPKGVKIRESRDSELHPNSTAIILGLDVTGSMGRIADNLARKGLGTLVEEILDRKPVSDPHLMIMGIGDANYDSAPLQIGQFEGDIAITKWLDSLYLEHGGGGNHFESYELPYYFAAYHTSIDCFEKRNKKGFLFTLGDEMPPKNLVPAQVKKVIGDDIQPTSFKDLIAVTEKVYEPFHIIVAEGHYAQSYLEQVKDAWMEILGQHVLVLSNWEKVSELVVSTIELCNGVDLDTIAKSWDGDTNMVITSALKDLSISKPSTEGGVVRL